MSCDSAAAEGQRPGAVPRLRPAGPRSVPRVASAFRGLPAHDSGGPSAGGARRRWGGKQSRRHAQAGRKTRDQQLSPWSALGWFPQQRIGCERRLQRSLHVARVAGLAM
ncbi:unnamed protein product [Prorocentrum cordatum]|uniref:Uncharacterized protein n=1 Tax=Prorocentrum cordatum TaxID=2364126 RepID=A0ABN9T3D0_9DINO|nr:unnamed protein product [Polarella glacialis]